MPKKILDFSCPLSQLHLNQKYRKSMQELRNSCTDMNLFSNEIVQFDKPFEPLVFCNDDPGLVMVMLLSMLRGKDINLIHRESWN